MNTKQQIFEILQEVIPNELDDIFNITNEKNIQIFVDNIIQDIKDNLD